MQIRSPVVDEVASVVKHVEPDAEVECYMSKSGQEGVGVEPLAQAVSKGI